MTMPFSPEAPIGSAELPLSATTPATNLAPGIRASLNAKLERLLDRPIIARIVEPKIDAEDEDKDEVDDDDDVPDVFRALQNAARAFTPTSAARQTGAWEEDPDDGTCSVRISLDYDDFWRGCEKEIRETVSNTVESAVTFLTDAQKTLLERSPREFLALDPRPEDAELLSFVTENIGGSERVVGLRLASAPELTRHIHYIAIVPNLVQIERQLDGLQQIENATDDGPLGPLRALVGLSDPPCLPSVAKDERAARTETKDRLDEYQTECVRNAMTTPHFAVIQGPPGSGKTTVITAIIRNAIERGECVLVVSPTHVAVDNVVEKLAPHADARCEDRLEKRSLPVRYAAKPKKLSDRALEYWVGSKKQRRGATIARRIQQRLSETIPFAEALFAMEDKDAEGSAPLSTAVARVETVICGTPIGILSFETVKNAEAGAFGVLIVDEVSKMTLPEFLAIAVKARRWVLVGDPEQLPPYNNAEENATTLDDVLDPSLELVCSVGAILERTKPGVRRDQRLVVVSSDPPRAAAAIRAHLNALMPGNIPSVGLLDDGPGIGIVVCSPETSDIACELLSPTRGRDRTHNPERSGTVPILVERGLSLERPDFASGTRLVEARVRAQALMYETTFNVYHAQPWVKRSGQKLPLVMFRKGLDKYLPSVAALASLSDADDDDVSPPERRRELIDTIAERFAINAVSVYDWLAGIPTTYFDTSPLCELEALAPAALCQAVRPFVGTLRKQYRMHSSLSSVPRELFYFGDALQDGRLDEKGGCRARLLQVEGGGEDGGESNAAEADAICGVLEQLNGAEAALNRRPGIMVITPYRKQEARLNKSVSDLRARGAIANLDVEVCTLDRCQGREAGYVLISLVRSRATPFLDMPKRWNVALTRAMQGLFIVGNIDAYLAEARAARQDPRAQPTLGNGLDGAGHAQMSMLARIIEAYDRHITASRRLRVR